MNFHPFDLVLSINFLTKDEGDKKAGIWSRIRMDGNLCSIIKIEHK